MNSEPKKRSAFKVFSGNANPELARKICDILGVPLSEASVKRFADGETDDLRRGAMRENRTRVVLGADGAAAEGREQGHRVLLKRRVAQAQWGQAKGEMTQYSTTAK